MADVGARVDDRILREQVALVYRQGLTGGVGNVLVALSFLGLCVWHHFPPLSTAPFVAVLLVYAVRLWHVIAFKNAPDARPMTVWRARMVSTSVAGGLAWASMGPCTMPLVSLEYQMTVIVVALGLTAAAVATLAPVRAAYLSYMVPITTSVGVSSFFFLGEAPVALALLQGLYALVMFRTSGEQSEAVGRSLQLAIENEALTVRAEEARARAEAASRAKSEFLARMSHEIRTPLNGVLGVHELMLGAPLGADERVLLETAHQSGRALLATINDLLDFSKIEAGKMTLERVAFELRPMVRELEALFSTVAQKQGVALRTAVHDDVPRAAWGDPGALRQVLTNLMGNALKFTPRGEVTLELSQRPEGIHFLVRDTGVGIEGAHRERIFESFEQEDSSTSRRFGGTGLGLSISRQLVALMGGTLTLESESGRGSTFFFTLPLEVAEGAAVAATREPSPTRTWAGCRVLVVDDEPVNRTIASAMLRRLGCEVVLASSGAEALEILSKEKFTLALMDCEMPERDGLSTTRALRAAERESSRARLPVIAFTAHATTAQRELCEAAEMDEMLTKPTTLADLDSCLGRWATPERNVG